MPYYIEILDAKQNKHGKYELPSDGTKFFIGRNNNEDGVKTNTQKLDNGETELWLLVPEQFVSGRHCVLFKDLELDKFFIEVSGKNGVEINEEKIKNALIPISPETSIVLPGNWTIKLTSDDEKKTVPIAQNVEGSSSTNGTTNSTPANEKVGERSVSSADNNDGCSFWEGNNNSKALYSQGCMKKMDELHSEVTDTLKNINSITKIDETNPEHRKIVISIINKKVESEYHKIQQFVEPEVFKKALINEILEHGPITEFLSDDRITEIMINGPNKIYIESEGKLYKTNCKFFNEQRLLHLAQRIADRVHRHVNQGEPMVDARLNDGSRVNVIVPPLALDGTSITIRKFSKNKMTVKDLIKYDSMDIDMAVFLEIAVEQRMNIVVSGGTGSGKTTLLNVLSDFIPKDQRVVTIEDSAELKLDHDNIVRLEARPANADGKGLITIRKLVINALRMRPDRIVVGECRGQEALDMLQAMNTGHDGSLTTLHANSSKDAFSRLVNMVMMAGFDLPVKVIREQIASAVNLIIQQSRLPDHTRKIVSIEEITGIEGDIIQTRTLFEYDIKTKSFKAVSPPKLYQKMMDMGEAVNKKIQDKTMRLELLLGIKSQQKH